MKIEERRRERKKIEFKNYGMPIFPPYFWGYFWDYFWNVQEEEEAFNGLALTLRFIPLLDDNQKK
jgi:hypothetical protein